MQAPTLSILIPAYEYAFGVKRILDLVLKSSMLNPELSFECIVSDDSRTNKVKRMIENHGINNHKGFKYYKRDKTLGGADNWNFLLEAARGDYIHFMHHDEFPDRDDFYSILIGQLESRPLLDVLFLRCYVPTFIKNRFRAHVSLLVRRLYFISIDGLFLRNTVGAPSCAVVRRNQCVLYDARLIWNVDIDWYYRILVQKNSVFSFSELGYISVLRSESISNSIRSEVQSIDRSERRLIKQKYSILFIDRFSDSSSFLYKAFLFLEFTIWHGARLCYYPFGLFFGKTISFHILGGEEDDR